MCPYNHNKQQCWLSLIHSTIDHIQTWTHKMETYSKICHHSVSSKFIHRGCVHNSVCQHWWASCNHVAFDQSSSLNQVMRQNLHTRTVVVYYLTAMVPIQSCNFQVWTKLKIITGYRPFSATHIRSNFYCDGSHSLSVLSAELDTSNQPWQCSWQVVNHIDSVTWLEYCLTHRHHLLLYLMQSWHQKHRL